MTFPNTNALASEPPRGDRQAEVDALAAKSDPLADDWPSEILAVYARRQLDALGQRLIEYARTGHADELRVADSFAPDAHVASLIPDSLHRFTAEGMSVRRGDDMTVAVEASQTPFDALTSLLQPFRGAQDLRITFDITSIDIVDDERFTTAVRYQASTAAPSGPLQQNAAWLVEWARSESPKHPRIRSIKVLAYDDITLDRVTFTECTISIVGDNDAWRTQLLRGGEYWYGRTDAAAELNYLGHNGIAIGDVNGDGLDDVYIATGSGLPNKLFVQNPDGTAREMAHEAGVAWLDDTKGVLLVDLDNDGDEDLLCAMGPSIVYCQNDGTGHFVPFRRLRPGTDAAFYSLAAADYDLDGDLDVYTTRYIKVRYGQSVPMPFHDANNGPPNHLLRNDGPDGFTDVTEETGLNVNNGRFSLAAAWADYDNDGDPDVLVANDFGRNNLYRNDGGKFVDVAEKVGVDAPAAGMGVSWSDIDLDGDFDLYVSNMFSSAGQRIAGQPRFKEGIGDDVHRQIQHLSLGNSLLVNNGDGGFLDRSDRAGVRMGGWAWGALFVDFDNDAYDDIVVPNGFLTNDRDDDLDGFFWRHVASRSPVSEDRDRDYINGWAAMSKLMDSGSSWSGRQRKNVFVNLRDGTFADASAVSGLDFLDDGRALAVTDWDGDGDLDLWFRNRGGPQIRFMRNNGRPEHHYVAFKLVGRTCNRDAVGAVVEVHSAGRKLKRFVSAGDGYLSQSSKWLHFGLGVADTIERVVIHWPGAADQELQGMPVDHRYRIEQGGEAVAMPTRPVHLADAPTGSPPPAGPFRVVLRVPLQLPPSLTSQLPAEAGHARLISLWTHRSTPCIGQLTDLATNDLRLHEAGLDLFALSIDKPGDREQAKTVFVDSIMPLTRQGMLAGGVATEAMLDALEIVLHHVLDRPQEIPAPAGLLIDPAGQLQIIYLGPVSVDQLLTDTATYGLHPEKEVARSSFAGRWYYGLERDLKSLARDFQAKGRLDDARFYLQLDRASRTNP